MSNLGNSQPQQLKSRFILFPNQETNTLPASAEALRHQFGILPYHAKLIAELQGYYMGGTT